jgi:hypothetical protein
MGLEVTAAVSLVISSGSTLGHNSGLKQYIYWYVINNAGVVELAASSKFFGMQGFVSTTAEGGAGAADSGTVMYSTAARSNVPFTCVGYTEDTQATAGTWVSNPSAFRLAPFAHPVVSFSAHKNGTNQTGVTTGAFTKVTWVTELYDNGALFTAGGNNDWTPPPGRINISACVSVTVTVDQTRYMVAIFKNNSEFTRSEVHASGTSAVTPSIAVEDECNGTDVYDVRLFHTAGSDRTISGTVELTRAFGSWEPHRS